MKKNKKIKLEDLKIQSFSTSQALSKDETDKLIGGTGLGCTAQPCTYTHGCLCESANPNCTAAQCSTPYSGCNTTGGGGPTSTPNCTYNGCTANCYDSATCATAAYYNC